MTPILVRSKKDHLHQGILQSIHFSSTFVVVEYNIGLMPLTGKISLYEVSTDGENWQDAETTFSLTEEKCYIKT